MRELALKLAVVIFILAGQNQDPRSSVPSSAQELFAGLRGPAGNNGTAILVGAGDIARCQDLSGARATARLLDEISGTVFAVGDLANSEGSEEQFRGCYDPTWGRQKLRTRPTPGNHEYHTSDASAYFKYFGPAAGEPGKGYYSYDLGDWHIVALNSDCLKVGGCGAGSLEERWLRNDLAAHPAPCTLAYWHHPLFSSGKNHGNDPEMKPFWQALYEAHAVIVINGHDHDYERFAPQDPNGRPDPVRGVREFVVGTGGNNLREFANSAPNSEVRYNSTFGVLKLTLHARSYEWQFIPVSGFFTDRGSGSCH